MLLDLRIDLGGMVVRTLDVSISRTTAVLENLTQAHSDDHMLSVLRSLAERDIKNVVVDLSKIGDASLVYYALVPLLEGTAAGLRLNVRYFGIRQPTVEDVPDAFYMKMVRPKFHESLDAAVLDAATSESTLH